MKVLKPAVQSRAVDKFFSLGVLTFTTHYKQLCAVAMCYILQIQMPKIWGCFSTPKHPLVYGLATTIECCKTEGVVDIFQVVKALRVQKPGPIPNVVSTHQSWPYIESSFAWYIPCPYVRY